MASEAAVGRYPYPTDDPETFVAPRNLLGNVAATITDARADLDDDVLQLTSSWESDTATLVVEDIGVLLQWLPRDAQRLGEAAEAIGTYVRDLRGVRDEIDDIRRRYDDAVAARVAADADVPEGIETNRYEREEYRTGNQRALDRAADLLDDEYGWTMRAAGGSQGTAVGALTDVLAALAPSSTTIEGDYGDHTYYARNISLNLVGELGASNDPSRRSNQADAFEELFGRQPTSPSDWQTAAMLDATPYQDKYGDTEAVLQVGRIPPQPGQGTIRIGLYIPSEEVFNVPDYDLGDDRGPDEDFDPEQTRVTLYIDYETGTVIARQNPSVDTSGEVRVEAPEVSFDVTTEGAVRLTYDAANPFAPPGSGGTHTVNGEVVVSPPAIPGGEWSLDGEIGDYPAFEAYQDDPLGRTQTLLQDAADNEGDFGPLLELPTHHDVGDGPESDAVKQFGDLGRPISGPYYEYTPRSGVPLGDVDDPAEPEPWPPFGEEPAEGGYV